MSSIPHAIAATLLVMVLYVFAVNAVKQLWGHQFSLNPLKLVADPTGRASLSAIQVLFFTIIVVWLATYWALQERTLVPIDNSLLALLGIASAGSLLGRGADAARFRVSGENWSWAKTKGWIKNDFTQNPTGRKPKSSDLITSDSGLDVARFQAVGFSFVIGSALLYEGATASDSNAFTQFTIDDAYLTLIGISQGVYVGGKVVGGNLIADLNAKLDELRPLELAFTTAVLKSVHWRNAAEGAQTMRLARLKAAPDEYAAYMSVAAEASTMVESLTGNSISIEMIEPNLPPIG